VSEANCPIVKFPNFHNSLISARNWCVKFFITITLDLLLRKTGGSQVPHSQGSLAFLT
jgi:hypothetical protein